MYKEYKDFDYEKFKYEFSNGDLSGLEYIGEKIIKPMKEEIKQNYDPLYFTKKEYIVDLYSATIELNYCNNMYETSRFKSNFNYDYYATIRDLLFQELEFDLEDIFNYENNYLNRFFGVKEN